MVWIYNTRGGTGGSWLWLFGKSLGFADDYLDSDWSVGSRPDLDIVSTAEMPYVLISLQW